MIFHQVVEMAQIPSFVQIREDINGKKKRFLSGIARMMGGGLPMPEFFGPFFLPSNSP